MTPKGFAAPRNDSGRICRRFAGQNDNGWKKLASFDPALVSGYAR
jgi:hypothetical protein